MDKKIIILLIAIIAVILVVGGLLMTNTFKQEPKIDIVTNGTVHTNTTFLVKSTASNNTTLANENISMK